MEEEMLATLILGLIGLIFVVVGGVLFFIARRGAQKMALIERVPTSPAAEATRQPPGTLVEVTGTLCCDAPLTAELSGRPCAFASVRVERQREVRERDSDGDIRTSTQSDIISHTSQSAPFSVEDQSGRIPVNPDGAEIDALTVVDRFEPAQTGASLSIGGIVLNLGSGDDTVGYRYNESLLPIDAPVYVLGVIAQDGSIGAPIAGHPDQAFTISYRSEAALLHSTGQTSFWLRVGGGAAIALGVILIVIGVVVGRL